jgi:hypothetical protein
MAVYNFVKKINDVQLIEELKAAGATKTAVTYNIHDNKLQIETDINPSLIVTNHNPRVDKTFKEKVNEVSTLQELKEVLRGF